MLCLLQTRRHLDSAHQKPIGGSLENMTVESLQMAPLGHSVRPGTDCGNTTKRSPQSDAPWLQMAGLCVCVSVCVYVCICVPSSRRSRRAHTTSKVWGKYGGSFSAHGTHGARTFFILPPSSFLPPACLPTKQFLSMGEV